MWCTTECWACEERKCEHYISKTELYFENQKKDKEIEKLRKTLEEIYSLTLVIDSKIMRKEYAQANKFNHIVRDKTKELKEVGKE